MSKTFKGIKCDPKEKTFCEYVQSYERADGHHGKGRGIYVANTHNINTNEYNVRLTYAWGTKTRQFAYLPFCPFCGTKLLEPKKEKAPSVPEEKP